MAVDPLDPNPGLRAEWQAALDVINPQIRGLINLARNQLSAAAAATIAAETSQRMRRAALLTSAIQSLDGVIATRQALADDGYPLLQDLVTPPDVLVEMQQLENDLVIGASVLGAVAPVVSDQTRIDGADAAVKANIAALAATMPPSPTP